VFVVGQAVRHNSVSVELLLKGHDTGVDCFELYTPGDAWLAKYGGVTGCRKSRLVMNPILPQSGAFVRAPGKTSFNV
jgi:hypothetical protein